MKYGFIGCGNMGGAIARGLSKVTTDIMVADRSGKAKGLAAELGLTYGDKFESSRRDTSIQHAAFSIQHSKERRFFP